jgi:hypothetical protein
MTKNYTQEPDKPLPYKNRESYWDYMGRRLREERQFVSEEDLWKREVAEMQKQVHDLQMRVVNLNKIVSHLNYKIEVLGGNSQQLELNFNAYI